MAEYYKLEIAKWNVATDDLTLEQEAAYHRVVGMIRLYERPLKHNLRVLSGLWRCNERKAKRLLDELVAAKKLSVEGELIIDEKAVNDASTLRQSRVEKQLAGRQGGIESGKSRRKALENNETDEAGASTREEKAREEKIKIDDDSARARDRPISLKARLAEAMGLDPEDATICDEAGMAEVKGWMKGYGLRSDEIVSVVAEVMAKRPEKSPPSSLAYFAKEMARLAEAKATTPEKPAPAKRAEATPPATEDEIMRFYADWINSDRPIPASTLKPNTARALLDAGLVTPDQLRAKGIAH
jgi:hypothetical protein